MTKQSLILIVYANLILSSCYSCTQTSVQSVMPSEKQHPIRTVQSTLREDLVLDWSLSSVKLRERTQLTAVQFGDKNHGRIGGQGGVLYSTGDGGRTWRTSQLDSGSRSYVSSMSFLRGAVGWVVVRRDPTEPMNRAGYESMVLKTNNAGQSWDEQRTWCVLRFTEFDS